MSATYHRNGFSSADRARLVLESDQDELADARTTLKRYRAQHRIQTNPAPSESSHMWSAAFRFMTRLMASSETVPQV